SNPIVYNFNGANELSLVKNGYMTMVSMATDASGNTALANAEAFIPCNASPEIPETMLMLGATSHSDQLSLYPNPTQGATEVFFAMPKTQWAQCQVLDLNGNVVKVLFQGYLEEGPQQITWDAHQLPSGMYLVQLQTEDDLQIQKIQIMR
ncbi:MAG: T9SS type A sorting domain-containing protein, partial [Bacteroidota bacterium]